MSWEEREDLKRRTCVSRPGQTPNSPPLDASKILVTFSWATSGFGFGYNGLVDELNSSCPSSVLPCVYLLSALDFSLMG